MPKLIDHDERKKKIANAVWKIMGEKGISSISIRNVAEEADISTGSLRNSFDSRVSLLAYALELIGETIEASVRANSVKGQGVLNSVKVLEHFLPLTPDTETIAKVTLGMIAEMRSTPGIHDAAQYSLNRVRSTYVDVLTWLRNNGELKTAIDIEVQADQLMMLGYGLTTKAIIGGERSDPVYLSRVFRSQINQILVRPVPYATLEDLQPNPQIPHA